MASTKLQREFVFSVPCPLQCLYCFAKTPEYLQMTSGLQSHIQGLSKPRIVYPLCDSEIHADKQFIRRLAAQVQSVTKDSPTIFSISTKTILSRDTVRELARLDTELRSRKSGLLKLSISASTYLPGTTMDFEKEANFRKTT